MKNPIGRPPEDYVLTREGAKFTLWFNQKEKKFLDEKSKKLRITKSELIRRMVQKAMMEQE